MNLTIFKEYLDCILNSQKRLNQERNTFIQLINDKSNAYSLFKQITHDQLSINKKNIKTFIQKFNWKLTLLEPTHSNYKLHSLNEVMEQSILEKGIQLLLRKWGSNSIAQTQFIPQQSRITQIQNQSNQLAMSYNNFTKMIYKRQIAPQRRSYVAIQHLKRLYTIFQYQIEHILNENTIKNLIVTEYNIQQLYNRISTEQSITKNDINKIYLMHSQRKTQNELNLITQRMKLPINKKHWINLFNIDQNKTQKIYYSARKNNKTFMTPKINKSNQPFMSSTKLTKAQKISFHSIDQFDQSANYTQQSDVIAQIIQLQKNFLTFKKKQIISHPNFDLELIYQRMGHLFQQILNDRYGCCNYTSFVRFLVPYKYEYRYLALIRYKGDNILPQRIKNSIEQILQQYNEKQQKISALWKNIDRQILFRSYCYPNSNKIEIKQIDKYFSHDEILILLERMDPSKLGYILFDYFK